MSSSVMNAEQLTDAFDVEFQLHKEEQLERSGGISTADWRAGGRRSKAYPNKEDEAWWLEHGPGMVRAYHEWRERMAEAGWVLWTAPGGVPAIELSLMAVFGTVPVKMGIDRVFVAPTGELAVVDLKTGGREPDSHLQLGFYACGMEMVLGSRPTYGAYYMARTEKLTDLVPLDKYSVGQLTNELEQFNRAIEAGIFLPRRGSHCKACGVARACSAVGGPDAPLYDELHPDFGKAST